MSKRCGFFGAECYDFIHYLARILYAMKYKVLIIDQSADRALESSIPLPDGYMIELDSTIDYRGVYYAGRYMMEYEEQYDYILIYYGISGQRFVKVNWLFLVDDGDVRVRKGIDGILPCCDKLLLPGSQKKTEDGYDSEFPVSIYLGPVPGGSQHEELVLPACNMDVVVVEIEDIILKLYCQSNGLFKFGKISNSYKDLLTKVVTSLLEGEVNGKRIRQAFRVAERGR